MLGIEGERPGPLRHRPAMGALPDQLVAHVAHPAGERRDPGQQVELPARLREIDRIDGAVVPGFGALGVQRQQHLGIGIGGQQLAPDAGRGIIHRGGIAGEDPVPVVERICRRVGYAVPEIEMALVGLVLDHLEHVIAAQAQLVQRRVGGHGSGAPETSADDLKSRGQSPAPSLKQY